MCTFRVEELIHVNRLKSTQKQAHTFIPVLPVLMQHIKHTKIRISDIHVCARSFNAAILIISNNKINELA